MLQLYNFFAWISVDERELVEYGVEHSEDQLTATCWIASEEGKTFVIKWKDAVRAENSMGRTFVDGVKCGVSKGINQNGYRKDATLERDSAQQRGAGTGRGTERLLMFSKLDVTDDDMYLDVPASDKIGEIRLEISYVRKGGRTSLNITPFKGQSKMHEMTKVIAQHHTKLGKLIMGDRKPVHRVKSYGHPRVFVFRYRPLEVLQAMGIAPREARLPQRVHLAYPQDVSRIVDLTMESDEDEPKTHSGAAAAASDDLAMSTQSAEEMTFAEQGVLDKKLMPNVPKTECDRVKIKLEDRKVKLEELETKFKPPVKQGIDIVNTEFGLFTKQDFKPVVKSETTAPLKTEAKNRKLVEQEGVRNVKLEFDSVVKIERLTKVGRDEVQILKAVPEVIDLTEEW